jgi:hypothetical protein
MNFLYIFLLIISYIFATDTNSDPLLEELNSGTWKESVSEDNENIVEIKEDKEREYQGKATSYAEEIRRIRHILGRNIPEYMRSDLITLYSKLYYYIKFNFLLALQLERQPDETIMVMLLKSFKKLNFLTPLSYENFNAILSGVYQRTILLMAILQNDYVFPDKFKEEMSSVLKSTDTQLFNGIILGKPLFFYLFFCKNLPPRITQKILTLTEEINNPLEVQKAILFHLKVRPALTECLPPRIGPLTRNQQILMPFFNTCTEIYRAFIQKKHANFDPDDIPRW